MLRRRLGLTPGARDRKSRRALGRAPGIDFDADAAGGLICGDGLARSSGLHAGLDAPAATVLRGCYAAQSA